MNISDRVASIEPSGTAEIFRIVARLKDRGEPVINLGVGEPADNTPSAIVGATKTALDQNRTRYSSTRGLSELKQAVAARLGDYQPDDIIITNGAKQALYACFQSILNPGDEVILPGPYWVSFSHQITLAGGIPIFVDTVSHQLNIEAIEKQVTDKTRAILINSPNNPTGAVYRNSDLEKISRLALERDLYIVSDETYQSLIYDEHLRTSGFKTAPVADRLIRIRSFSKQYAMTGFRIGYAAGPRHVIDAMGKLQSHLCGNVCTFAQHGACAAFDLDENLMSDQITKLESNKAIAFDFARRLFDCIEPQGGFYVFPDVSRYLGNGRSADDFARMLLEKARVAVVPGEAFGVEDHIRISFAVSTETLVEGLERIEKVL